MGGASDVARPVAAMVVVQVVFAGVNIFYKLAVCDGMDMRVLVAYRYLLASAVLAPLAYFVERRNRTKLTWRVVVLSFICGLTGGSLAQNLYISGMKLTSATFASAMTNLIPAITFVLALLFRYERLAVRTLSGQAKVAGTFLGVGGAMLLTFYKGADITPWTSHIDLAATLTARRAHLAAGVHPAVEATNRVMGSLLVIGGCFFYAIWLILQAKLSREYPFHYSSTALMCLMSTMQSVAFALCYDRGVAQWRLGFDIRLLSVVYSGVLASGVMLVVLSWCVKRRGPLFASVFNPLMLVVVAVLSSLLLGERLHLGSALGAVLIVMGLYAVLWGKGRETATEAAKVGELPEDDDGERIYVVVHRPSSCAQQIQPDQPRDSAATVQSSEEDKRKLQEQQRSTT
ncbi:WAT1-related protein At1g68170-like [Phragmites australis]|uniref:WAT1-related protein At1g68170-like n=1 Tax=Phragmites australis TaxID=29695 RepID=UPI002D7766EC|nr:WAT1-related protein At1g68170-like [Phragmites australis]